MNDHEFPPARASWLVVVGAVAILISAFVVSVTFALLAFAAFAFAGAALRVIQPTRRAFTVRRRAVDVSVLVVFGAALVFLALTTPLSA